MPQRPPPRSLALLATCLLIPPVAAGFLGRTASQSAALGALLLLEPVLAALTAYLAILLVRRRLFLPGAGLLVGMALALTWLHLYRPQGEVEPTSLPWALEAARCAEPAEPPSAPLRLLSWSMAGQALTPDVLDKIILHRPDVLLLSHLDGGDDLVSQLARALPGEIVEAERGPVMVVRGEVRACGATAAPLQWQPPGAGHRESLLFTLAAITGVGLVPVVGFQGPTPAEGGWPGQVEALSNGVATATILGGPSAVALGNIGVPPTFQAVVAPLLSPGLTLAPTPATWPNRVFRLPAPAIHRFDRVVMGDAWQPHGSLRGRAGGSSLPLLVGIEPAHHTARQLDP